EAGAERVANRILQLVSDKRVGPSGAALPLSISIGVAMLDPSLREGEAHPSSNAFFHGMARSLFRRADEGLYQAKRDGRNRMRNAGTMRLDDVTPPDEEGAGTIAPPAK